MLRTIQTSRRRHQMLELYFIFYRVPKMMTRVAREQNRSALGWSLIGIGTWIGVEIFVIFALTFMYQFLVAGTDWTEPQPAGFRFVAYLLALIAALLAVTGLTRWLESKRSAPYRYPSPPPPPTFSGNRNG
jgi:hypothetical protein